MAGLPKSPRILQLSWGRLEIEGAPRPYKDAKLFPGGSREWNWKETNTQHVPGIQPEDVKELVDHGAEVVVLSTGMYRQLQVPKQTVQFLESRGVEVLVLPTAEAVERYNQLAGRAAVGGLIHSTC